MLVASCTGDKKTASNDSVASPDSVKADSAGLVKSANQPDTAKFDLLGKYKFFFDEIIDPGTAKDMIDLYRAKRKTMIDQKYGIDDTKSVTYSIDKMEEFVSNVKAKGGTGVRIYFGVYPSAGKYPGQTTLIAIGTKLVNGVETDMLMSTTLPGPTTAADGLDPYNHGNLCPPAKNCGY